jgi:DNA-binding NarL/FixJ family response regulator
MTVVRVLTAEAHPLVRKGVATSLAAVSGLRVVGEAANHQRVTEILRDREVDVIVAGHLPPVLDGFALLQATRALRRQTHVILLADGMKDAQAAFRAGAAAWLPKSVTPEQLVAAVRAAVLVGNIVTADLMHDLIGVARVRAPAGEEAALSQREREVLQLVASDKRVSDVARELYVTDATVRTHLARIYRKLFVSSAAAAVAEAMRRRLID